jgi:hypothetical protein
MHMHVTFMFFCGTAENSIQPAVPWLSTRSGEHTARLPEHTWVSILTSWLAHFSPSPSSRGHIALYGFQPAVRF